MGSSYRNTSNHLADIKGKEFYTRMMTNWSWYLPKYQRISVVIDKILNPKKQNVEKLLHKMPAQWGLQDRITANDLGNGKFLLNFTSEEDLSSVLRQGPFHFNFCMFVLVRWEPIVHDDYPWIIPFLDSLDWSPFTSMDWKKPKRNRLSARLCPPGHNRTDWRHNASRHWYSSDPKVLEEGRIPGRRWGYDRNQIWYAVQALLHLLHAYWYTSILLYI